MSTLETDKPFRVMWLLNHSAARRFEVMMLRRIGITEIFLPKRFPDDVSFRSASVDYSLDGSLSIPPEELAVLNDADWYGRPGSDAWAIANRHFDVLFFIPHKPEIFDQVARQYKGLAIWRAYGNDLSMSYTRLLQWSTQGRKTIEKLGRRFRLGVAYEHLPDIEDSFLRNRALYLPLGMSDPEPRDKEWRGSDPTILFVCPDLAFNSYYRQIYDEFVTDFGDLPYKIGGSQPIQFHDPHVLGYLPTEAYARNMREFRVMFYHSREPNHVHYHPFEAIRAGMPLVFMAGSLLDRLGGIGLPGRCETVSSAREKLQAILAGDRALIEEIRSSQLSLLEPMHPDRCEPFWREGFKRIKADLESERRASALRPKSFSRPRVAVILPIAYRGGTLRMAKLIAEALWQGSRDWDEPADVVFAYPEDGDYIDDLFDDLPPVIARRTFLWRRLDSDAARRAMRFQGHSWVPEHAEYQVPDDGIAQFIDCECWLFISDRVSKPVLPIRPYLAVVFDYLQRYYDVVDPGLNGAFLRFARLAQSVLVTTKFTERNALEYAGVTPDRLHRVPILMPQFRPKPQVIRGSNAPPYFLWPTNAAPHKNHLNAITALRIYYEDLGGTMDCKVTGVNSADLVEHPPREEVARAVDLVKHSTMLSDRLVWYGELSDRAYCLALAGAAFVWHPARLDNGTFSVIEATQYGVPSLSSDYPAMRELDHQLSLGLTWMNPLDSFNMARQLKWMEDHLTQARARLPTEEQLSRQNPSRYAREYWQAVRDSL